MRKKNYWIPQFKWQLIYWLEKNSGYSPKKLKIMNKKQLYAIYFSTRG